MTQSVNKKENWKFLYARIAEGFESPSNRLADVAGTPEVGTGK